jgi:nucleoside-diphosphate-sugar epimerase
MRTLLFAPAKAHNVETVIHTALHRAAHATGSRVHQLNVESTRELLRLCEDHPTIRTFVLRSHAEIYRVRAVEPEIIDERHPIDLSPEIAQWLRDRAEADLTTCASIGLSSLSIRVLRCAECLAPDTGSQLFDYLRSQICFQPLGFDPMINLISLPDLARAFASGSASAVEWHLQHSRERHPPPFPADRKVGTDQRTGTVRAAITAVLVTQQGHRERLRLRSQSLPVSL